MKLKDPRVSVLGTDPTDRSHRINANSFQQNALTTVNGWQYAAFYTNAAFSDHKRSCYPNLTRRKIHPTESSDGVGQWETICFDDYEQTVDDGHNTISIGVCSGDGTVHMAFDHHCDELKFRISGPKAEPWNTSLFSRTQNFLPGIPSNSLMKEITYPRFVNINNDLLLTYRIGQAGLGSDILYHYSSETHLYTYIGQHLTGVSNSPYINGIDYRLSRLHISWCYRNFFPVPPSMSPNAYKQQAGPNGPENNFDLNYAFSDDLGSTWKSSGGNVLAKLGGAENTIKPGAEGARVFEIPMGSGILNQESQVADNEGGFWVLNRGNYRNGLENWIVYYRDFFGKWTEIEIYGVSSPTETGPRGSICVDKNNYVYLVLPGNGSGDSRLSIMQGKWAHGYAKFETIWEADGFEGEPLVDNQRLEIGDVLSVFTRTVKKSWWTREVVILDFDLS